MAESKVHTQMSAFHSYRTAEWIAYRRWLISLLKAKLSPPATGERQP